MSNIHGLGKAPPKEKPTGKNKKDEEFNVGGGQQVMRPTNRGGNNQSADLMQFAQRSNQDVGENPVIGQITLYANGFHIGNSEFRDITQGPNAEQNRRFLQELQNGEVPRELDKEIVAEFGPAIEKVGIALVDKTQETYVPPKEKFSFAKSQGQSLISGTDTKDTPGAFTNATRKRLVDSKDDNAYTIQLVLHDRTKSKIRVAPSTTILDIYRHVLEISNVHEPFKLIAGFPPKHLDDPHQTVEQAKLKNASVVQKC